MRITSRRGQYVSCIKFQCIPPCPFWFQASRHVAVKICLYTNTHEVRGRILRRKVYLSCVLLVFSFSPRVSSVCPVRVRAGVGQRPGHLPKQHGRRRALARSARYSRFDFHVSRHGIALACARPDRPHRALLALARSFVAAKETMRVFLGTKSPLARYF